MIILCEHGIIPLKSLCFHGDNLIKMKKIIFDTDLGGDCDDVMALDLLLACEKAGECELVGVTYSADAKNAVPCIHSILRRHGRGGIPIGRAPVDDSKPVRSDVYATRVAEAFASPGTVSYDEAADAVALLRGLLAANESVTLCVTGFLTNIAALLLSQPDEISPLDGMTLVSEKVSEIAVMGCRFSHQNGIYADHGTTADPEWNIVCDIGAAQKVFGMCPVPLVICPFEVGYHMITGAGMVKRGGENDPDSLSYIVHGSINGRDSWDPATALYAVRGSFPYFTKTPGNCMIKDDGTSYFTECGDGRHICLECALPQTHIACEIDRIVSLLD